MKNRRNPDFFPPVTIILKLSPDIVQKLMEKFCPIGTESQIRYFKPLNSQTVSSFKLFSVRSMSALLTCSQGFCGCYWTYVDAVQTYTVQCSGCQHHVATEDFKCDESKWRYSANFKYTLDFIHLEKRREQKILIIFILLTH